MHYNFLLPSFRPSRSLPSLLSVPSLPVTQWKITRRAGKCRSTSPRRGGILPCTQDMRRDLKFIMQAFCCSPPHLPSLVRVRHCVCVLFTQLCEASSRPLCLLHIIHFYISRILLGNPHPFFLVFLRHLADIIKLCPGMAPEGFTLVGLGKA